MNLTRLKIISSGARTPFAHVMVRSLPTRQNPNPSQEISPSSPAPNSFQPVGEKTILLHLPFQRLHSKHKRHSQSAAAQGLFN